MNVVAIAVGALELVSGAVLGSFATTAAMRGARGQSWSRGRSCCDACGRALTYVETLPLLSYARRLGRCSHCGAPINWLHPLSEAIGAIVVFCAFQSFSTPVAIVSVLFGLAILYASVFDVLTLRIPDLANGAILGLGAILAFLGDRLLLSAVVAVAIFGILSLAKSQFLRLRGREGIGGGDVKLMAALCLGLGLHAFSWTLVAASGLALMWIVYSERALGQRPRRLPFGPFLGLGWGVITLGAHLT